MLSRLVTKPGTDTVVENVLRDGTAFARVPEPGACSFCLMLASRGAVYTRRSVGSVNRFHDNCRCLGIECRRDGSNLPRINRDLHQLWHASDSSNQADFRLALNTRREFASVGDPRNTSVYRLPDESARGSIERWQGMDRFYAKVQKAADGASDDPEALKVLDELDDAARKTPLESDVLMWRGVRNWHAEFEVESYDELLGAGQIQMSRFKALSADREQSEADFTSHGKAGALLRLKVKKGTPGIWMPTNGDEKMISQQEFLAPPGAMMRVIRVEKGEVPVIHVEMSYE